MTEEEIKSYVKQLGADLCGIAGIERFAQAPVGYHPTDTFPTCQSVISFACRFPVATLQCNNAVPYTRVRNSMSPKLDDIALNLCIELERHNILAVPVPTNEGQWDSRTNRRRSIVSLKHAAEAAGTGTIGRNSLLITPQYGSMVWLGCVLTDAKLEEDPLLDCICNQCNLCINTCPVHALDELEVNQNNCWNHAFGENSETQDWQITCHQCRDICPYNLGSENRFDR